MSRRLTHLAGKAWIGAHRLVTYPNELTIAQALAKKEPDPARLLAQLSSDEPSR